VFTYTLFFFAAGACKAKTERRTKLAEVYNYTATICLGIWVFGMIEMFRIFGTLTASNVVLPGGEVVGIPMLPFSDLYFPVVFSHTSLFLVRAYAVTLMATLASWAVGFVLMFVDVSKKPAAQQLQQPLV
jgi:hypothetical protein